MSNKYHVNKSWSRWNPGAILDESELPRGLDIAKAIERGTITPYEGGHVAPLSDEDVAGWKARAQSLEEQNQRLRTATPAAETLSELEALKEEHAALLSAYSEVRIELDGYKAASVSIDAHKQLQAQFDQLSHTHESTVVAIEEEKAKNAQLLEDLSTAKNALAEAQTAAETPPAEPESPKGK